MITPWSAVVTDKSLGYTDLTQQDFMSCPQYTYYTNQCDDTEGCEGRLLN